MRRLSRVSVASAMAVAVATAVFMAVLSIAEGMVIHPLGSARIGSSVAVFARHLETGRDRQLTSLAVFRAWRECLTSFAVLSGYQPLRVTLGGEPMPLSVDAARAEDGFFDALGARVARGRTLASGDFFPGAARVLVISDTLWHSRFGGRTDIVGTRLRLETPDAESSGSYTVVGVASAAFRFPRNVDIWIPLIAAGARAQNPSGQWFAVVGRLRPGVSYDAAGAELDTVAGIVQRELPRAQPPHAAYLVSVRSEAAAESAPLVAALVAAALVLLLSVLATAGALLTAKSLRHDHDRALRISLGASRSRLLRHAAIEAVATGIATFVAALPLSLTLLVGLAWLATDMTASPPPVQPTRAALAAGLVLAVGASVALGMWVEAHALRRVPASSSLRWATTSRQRPLPDTLVIGEVILTAVAVCLAATAIRHLQAMRATDLGFNPEGLLAARVDLPSARYDDARAQRFVAEVLERLGHGPGVTGVAAASDEPLFGLSANPEFVLDLEHRPLAPDERAPVLVNGVTASYFDVLGIPILDGQPALGDGRLAAVVNHSFAARFYGDVSPVGRRFRFGGRDAPWWTIVGVAADTRNDGPARPPKPTVYMARSGYSKSGTTYFVRTAADATGIAAFVRTVLAELDPDIPIGGVLPASTFISARYRAIAVASIYLTAVAAIAQALTGAGLLGLVAALAAARRRDIAIRLALGATGRQAATALWRQMARVVSVGVPAGLVAGIGASHVLARTLSVAPVSGVDTLLVGVAIAGLSWVAPLVRAARAGRVAPAELLRLS